jgi:hypothetical protein
MEPLELKRVFPLQGGTVEAAPAGQTTCVVHFYISKIDRQPSITSAQFLSTDA